MANYFNKYILVSYSIIVQLDIKMYECPHTNVNVVDRTSSCWMGGCRMCGRRMSSFRSRSGY